MVFPIDTKRQIPKQIACFRNLCLSSWSGLLVSYMKYYYSKHKGYGRLIVECSNWFIFIQQNLTCP